MKRSVHGRYYHRTKWNIFALPQWRTVWMLMPKAASTSIRLALARELGLPTSSGHDVKEFQGLAASDAIRLRDEGYLTIGSIRHPVERLISCWSDKVAGEHYYTEFTVFDEFYPGMPFEEFALAVAAIPDEDAEPHFRSMSYDLTSNGEIIPELLIEQATLSRDWNQVRARIAWRTDPHIWLPDLGHANRSSRGDRLESLAPATLRLLRERYADDFTTFGYPDLPFT